MRLQLRRSHSIDSPCSLVAFHRPQRQPVVLVCHDCFHQLLVHCSPSKGPQSTGIVPPRGGWLRLHRLVPLRSRVGYRSCCARDSSSLLAPASSSFSSSVPWFFGPSLQPHYRPSSLLRPLLTSPSLSGRRSPQVRCRICLLVPTGST